MISSERSRVALGRNTKRGLRMRLATMALAMLTTSDAGTFGPTLPRSRRSVTDGDDTGRTTTVNSGFTLPSARASVSANCSSMKRMSEASVKRTTAPPRFETSIADTCDGMRPGRGPLPCVFPHDAKTASVQRIRITRAAGFIALPNND